MSFPTLHIQNETFSAVFVAPYIDIKSIMWFVDSISNFYNGLLNVCPRHSKGPLPVSWYPLPTWSVNISFFCLSCANQRVVSSISWKLHRVADLGVNPQWHWYITGGKLLHLYNVKYDFTLLYFPVIIPWEWVEQWGVPKYHIIYLKRIWWTHNDSTTVSQHVTFIVSHGLVEFKVGKYVGELLSIGPWHCRKQSSPMTLFCLIRHLFSPTMIYCTRLC